MCLGQHLSKREEGECLNENGIKSGARVLRIAVDAAAAGLILLHD